MAQDFVRFQLRASWANPCVLHYTPISRIDGYCLVCTGGKKIYPFLQILQIFPSFLPCPKNNNLFFFILFQQFIDHRKLIPGKVQNPLPKFLIKDRFLPRQILSFFSDSGLCAFQAYFQRIIQQKYSIAHLNTPFHRPQIISINDPPVFFHDFL